MNYLYLINKWLIDPVRNMLSTKWGQQNSILSKIRTIRRSLCIHVLPKRFYHSKNINFSVYIKIPRVKISKAIKIHQLDSNVYFCLYQNQHHANEQTEIF